MAANDTKKKQRSFEMRVLVGILSEKPIKIEGVTQQLVEHKVNA